MSECEKNNTKVKGRGHAIAKIKLSTSMQPIPRGHMRGKCPGMIPKRVPTLLRFVEALDTLKEEGKVKEGHFFGEWRVV